ncbi:Ig-like domain-containing protein [Aquimarina sp. RZ0]|uniref:Ig-like domain-containing protein n=1 Tax=Aquimarina sp. RZ0 TaxID=2607730 RepID=UPI0011F2F080|nr:Ig-like domain-containing protein [Aquimarina sp. RZ0]KAA1243906.1 hypothetical protein F0000_18765 [Aquimarina sp. RZ0]
MRIYIFFIILLIYHTSEMFAQTPLDFTFSQNEIIVPRRNAPFDELKVYRGEISGDKLFSTNAILGKIVTEDIQLRFIPVIPFGQHQKYTLFYDGIIDYFTINIPNDYTYLTVQSIYPSDKMLPANLLKWYVRFSKPVNEAFIYDHIQFINARGDTLHNPILHIENALLSDQNTLLTIWIDPGRQKRDLSPNIKLGAVFKKNNSYTLIISKKLKDHQGIPMQQNFNHQFNITEADRIQPNIDFWKIQTPKADSKADLIINCEESLDYGSSLEGVLLTNSIEGTVPGNWKLIDHESVFVFTPADTWRSGRYTISFDKNIEDLAGNNLERLFDSDITNHANTGLNKKEYKIAFTIR